MPDWKSIWELQTEQANFPKLILALWGIYAYEWLISLDFDWSFMTGKRRFNWRLVFYFANRYLLLVGMICYVIVVNSTKREIDCHAFYAVIEFTGYASAGLASINLSIRTIAIWANNKYIVGGLVLVILGHWSLIFQGCLQLKVNWLSGIGCFFIETNNKIVAAIFIYSMCFDLMILLLNTYKLLSYSSSFGMSGGSRMAHMMFTDGLIFFLIAFLGNLIATVFVILNLNQIMSLIFNVPACVFSTVGRLFYLTSGRIAACRAVRRLKTFNDGADQLCVLSSGDLRSNHGGVTDLNDQSMQFQNPQTDVRSDLHIRSNGDSHV